MGKQRHEETYQTKKSRVQAASMEGSEVETQKQLLQCRVQEGPAGRGAEDLHGSMWLRLKIAGLSPSLCKQQ